MNATEKPMPRQKGENGAATVQPEDGLGAAASSALTDGQADWLRREVDKVSKLKAADNRMILWLAMQTEPWLNCDPLSTAADILAELESRMYPEYDGDSVRMTEWGWQTPEGEIRYLPNVQAQIPRTQDVANTTDNPERLSAALCSSLVRDSD